MGRTNPTFRDRLRRIERRWDAYRRALRRPDQEAFDRLFAQAATHADAAGQLNPGEPLHPILVSILLEQEQRIAALEDRLDTNRPATIEGDRPSAAVDGDPEGRRNGPP